jgi:TonB family protein
MKPTSQALSIALHALAILALLLWPHTEFAPPPLEEDQIIRPQKLIWMRPPAPAKDGGGARQPRLATRGAIPEIIHRPFQPPKVQQNLEPKLILASGVDVPVPRIDLPLLGDPNSKIAGDAPSGGTGNSNSIGNDGTGKRGNQGGNDTGGSTLTRVAGATPPLVLHKVEPDYSDEARKVRLQGSVLIAIDIDDRGNVSNIRVLRPLGMGLDEKAIDAVAKWRFRPAMKDGRAIPYPAAIEVRFQLL